jgi:AcrR family transcriptional regulator
MPPDPAETRRRILDAFADCYGQSGSADVETVASAAGVSRSTVYRHFANAGEMLEAARQEGLAEGARLIERHLAAALRGEPGTDVLDGVLGLLADVFRNGVPMGRVLRRDTAADETIQAHYGRLAEEIIRRAQRDGVISASLDPTATYVAAVGLCRGLIVAAERGQISADGASGVAKAFLGSLRPAASPTS